MVRVTVANMGGSYASEGVVIESNQDRCCPKLRPGQVIEVAPDHPVARHPCCSLTDKAVTRPVRYLSSQDAALADGKGSEGAQFEKIQMMEDALIKAKANLDARLGARQEAQYFEPRPVTIPEITAPVDTRSPEEKLEDAARTVTAVEQPVPGKANKRNQHVRAGADG